MGFTRYFFLADSASDNFNQNEFSWERQSPSHEKTGRKSRRFMNVFQ
jgi:hypothetical protein